MFFVHDYAYRFRLSYVHSMERAKMYLFRQKKKEINAHRNGEHKFYRYASYLQLKNSVRIMPSLKLMSFPLNENTTTRHIHNVGVNGLSLNLGSPKPQTNVC